MIADLRSLVSYKIQMIDVRKTEEFEDIKRAKEIAAG
jgi:hypothetical protein